MIQNNLIAALLGGRVGSQSPRRATHGVYDRYQKPSAFQGNWLTYRDIQPKSDEEEMVGGGEEGNVWEDDSIYPDPVPDPDPDTEPDPSIPGSGSSAPPQTTPGPIAPIGSPGSFTPVIPPPQTTPGPTLIDDGVSEDEEETVYIEGNLDPAYGPGLGPGFGDDGETSGTVGDMGMVFDNGEYLGFYEWDDVSQDYSGQFHPASDSTAAEGTGGTGAGTDWVFTDEPPQDTASNLLPGEGFLVPRYGVEGDIVGYNDAWNIVDEIESGSDLTDFADLGDVSVNSGTLDDGTAYTEVVFGDGDAVQRITHPDGSVTQAESRDGEYAGFTETPEGFFDPTSSGMADNASPDFEIDTSLESPWDGQIDLTEDQLTNLYDNAAGVDLTMNLGQRLGDWYNNASDGGPVLDGLARALDVGIDVLVSALSAPASEIIGKGVYELTKDQALSLVSAGALTPILGEVVTDKLKGFKNDVMGGTSHYDSLIGAIFDDGYVPPTGDQANENLEALNDYVNVQDELGDVFNEIDASSSTVDQDAFEDSLIEDYAVSQYVDALNNGYGLQYGEDGVLVEGHSPDFPAGFNPEGGNSQYIDIGSVPTDSVTNVNGFDSDSDGWIDSYHVELDTGEVYEVSAADLHGGEAGLDSARAQEIIAQGGAPFGRDSYGNAYREGDIQPDGNYGGIPVYQVSGLVDSKRIDRETRDRQREEREREEREREENALLGNALLGRMGVNLGGLGVNRLGVQSGIQRAG